MPWTYDVLFVFGFWNLYITLLWSLNVWLFSTIEGFCSISLLVPFCYYENFTRYLASSTSNNILFLLEIFTYKFRYLLQRELWCLSVVFWNAKLTVFVRIWMNGDGFYRSGTINCREGRKSSREMAELHRK